MLSAHEIKFAVAVGGVREHVSCTYAYDVHKIFGILDPYPLSAFHATYQSYRSAKLGNS